MPLRSNKVTETGNEHGGRGESADGVRTISGGDVAVRPSPSTRREDEASVQWTKGKKKEKKKVGSTDGGTVNGDEDHVIVVTSPGRGGKKGEGDSASQRGKEDDSTVMCFSKGKLVLFLFLLFMDLSDFVSDWLFYMDVKLAEQGLVYGPVEPLVLHFLLAFSIVGTLTFIAEVINLYLEMFKEGRHLVDSDLLSAVVVWVEDVPQVGLSLHIALCREEPISVFQLTKAAVILLGVVVRIIITCVKYCNKKELHSHHHVLYKVLIFLGVLLEAGCAGAIFFLVNTERTEAGRVNFRVPQTLIRDQFNDQRYFAGAAIFAHHHDLFDKGKLDPNPVDDLKVNWLRVAWLDDVRSKGTVYMKLDYQVKSADEFNLAVSRRDNAKNAKWTISECYSVRNQNGQITQQLPTSLCTLPTFMNKPTGIVLAFKFTPPGNVFKKRVFGHMVFNAKIQNGNSCRDLHNVVSDKIEDEAGKNSLLTLHFYRTGQDIHLEDAKHLNHKVNGTPKFYENDGNTIVDVRDAWKTGWRQCSMTGYVAPPLDKSLEVPCIT